MDDIEKYNNKMIRHFNYVFNKLNSADSGVDGVSTGEQHIQVQYMVYNTSNLIDILQNYKKIYKYNAIILSGSSKRVLEEGAPDLPKEILRLKIPILGLCYGFQWMVKVLGGKVATFLDKKEHKYNKWIEFKKPFNISTEKYYFYHHDYIQELPHSGSQWESIYENNQNNVNEKNNEHQIWIAENKKMGLLGLQFHPESHRKSAIAFYSTWIAWLKENI
jgi:GMP synthase-like glutamine amidotransferase